MTAKDNSNSVQKILAKIKTEKIIPHERWIFLVKNYGIWVLAIVALFFAAIFVGISIADLLEAEWELWSHFPGGRINFVARTLPIFWFAAIVACVALAFFLFRKTKRGYRFGMIALAGVIFVASVAGGLSLLSTPLPPKFLDLRDQHFPPKSEIQKWQNPAEGFLFGEIVELRENSILLLDAIDGSKWEVDFATAKIPNFLELKIGDKIRAIGKKIDEREFAAEFIRPEKPPRELERVRKNLMKEISPVERINSRSAPQI